MHKVDKGLDQFVHHYYGNKPEHFKEELNAIIFYLHYVDADAVSQKEVRDACVLLRSLVKAVE